MIHTLSIILIQLKNLRRSRLLHLQSSKSTFIRSFYNKQYFEMNETEHENMPRQEEKYEPNRMQNALKFQAMTRKLLLATCLRIFFMLIVYYDKEQLLTPQEEGKRGYQPWNTMIFMISSSIDLITIIGYISTLKILNYEKKIILAVERGDQGQIHNLKDEKAYSSLYSMICTFKFTQKDIAAPYRFSRYLHIFMSYCVFGNLALLSQHHLNTNFSRCLILWLFLLSSYVINFQFDLAIIQSSPGPYVKRTTFLPSKFREVYNIYHFWKSRYGLYILMAIIGYLLSEIWNSFHDVNPVFLCFKILLIAVSMILYLRTNALAENKQERINKILSEKDEKTGCVTYRNLSIIGIYYNQTVNSRVSSQILSTTYRICLVLCWFALFRASFTEFLSFTINSFPLILASITQMKKFKALWQAQYNLLNSCYYRQIMDIQRKLKKDEITIQEDDSSCSICLLSYEQNDMIILSPCWHIFHESCLEKWVKSKKQCPLCRTSLHDYFQK